MIGIAAVVVAAVAAVNVNFALQSNGLSALSLANVEALAEEDDASQPTGPVTRYDSESEEMNYGSICYLKITTTATTSCTYIGTMPCYSGTTSDTQIIPVECPRNSW